jgi:Na+/H+-dicarboxylate symporter
MTLEKKSKRIYPYIILWLLLAFPLSILFADFLGSYWKYWEMENVGDVFYLLLITLPSMFVLFLVAGTITSFVMRKYNCDGWKIFLFSLLNMAITFVIAFAFEVLQNFNYPTSKKGNLFEFLIQYFAKWI